MSSFVNCKPPCTGRQPISCQLISCQLATTWNKMQWRVTGRVYTAVGLASWVNATAFAKVILVVLFPICRFIITGNRSRSVRCLPDNIPWGHCSSCISGCGLRITLQNSFAGVADLRYLASICNETKSPISNERTEEKSCIFGPYYFVNSCLLSNINERCSNFVIQLEAWVLCIMACLFVWFFYL